MKDKYYTPSLEEFHVGFEFEWVKPDRTETIKLECLNNIGFLWGITIPEGVRVKYLDREDIESLGFEYDGKSCLDETWEKEESIVDTWSYYVDTTEDKEKYYSLYSQGKLCYITYTAYQNSVGSTVEQVFKGTIKNKSELKKVLKMLNIN